jgi:hypothetical protein
MSDRATIPGPVLPKFAVPVGLGADEIEAERAAYTKRQNDRIQADIAAGRAAIAADQSKQRLGASSHVRAKDLSADEAGAHASLGVAQRKVDAITFKPDVVSKADPNIRTTGLDFRIAHVQCTRCNEVSRIAQRLPLTGDGWMPDAPTQLAKFGWKFDGERWFCGATCCMFWTQAFSSHAGGVTQPVAVTHVNDKSYAVKAYATEPAVVATPAVAAPAPAQPAPQPTARRR